MRALGRMQSAASLREHQGGSSDLASEDRLSQSGSNMLGLRRQTLIGASQAKKSNYDSQGGVVRADSSIYTDESLKDIEMASIGDDLYGDMSEGKKVIYDGLSASDAASDSQ